MEYPLLTGALFALLGGGAVFLTRHRALKKAHFQPDESLEQAFDCYQSSLIALLHSAGSPLGYKRHSRRFFTASPVPVQAVVPKDYPAPPHA